MNNTDIALIVGCVGSILAFLTGVANMIQSNYIAARNRRWQQEDAEKVAAALAIQQDKTEKIVRHVGNNVSQVVTARADEADVARHELSDKLDVNTKVSTDAFTEANGVNKKIEALGFKLNDAPKEVTVVNKDPIPVKEVSV